MSLYIKEQKMKRKILLFFIFAVISVCAFAMAVSASGFSNQGANGQGSIFSFLGYSTNENGGICVGYDVDVNALESYEASTGTSLKYGIVIASRNFVEGASPLDSNGNATGANKDKIIVVDLTEKADRVFASITGINDKNSEKYLIMSLYVLDSKSGVTYVGDKLSDIGPQSITFKNALLGLPATPAIPVVTEATVSGITYSTLKETVHNSDRVRQMAASAAVYNTTTMSDSDAKNITDKANLVITGGSLIGWSNAASLLQHFLDGSGEQYTLNMTDFLNDSNNKSYRNTEINRALRAAELLAREGEYITMRQVQESKYTPKDDWYYAMGTYFCSVDMMNLTVTVDENGIKHYSADIKYIATDFYNWDKNNTTPVINKKVLFFTITGPSPAELYRLHEAGRAREFLTYGEITYKNITWTEGQEVPAISGLN